MAYITDGLTPNAAGFAGVTTNFRFSYDSTLQYDAQTNPNGPEPTRTNAVIAACENDRTILSNWFGGNFNVTGMAVQVTTANSGASWSGGSLASTISLNPGGYDFTNNPGYLRYLIISEVSEIFMLTQARTGMWFYGTNNGGNEGSKGEGLSRFLGGQFLINNEFLGLGIAKVYSVADNWLNSVRNDYVTVNVDDYGDDATNGCTTLFIYYLYTQLGYSINQITAAGAETLALVYTNLSGDAGNPFPAFNDLLSDRFPSHINSAVPGPNFDNPWPILTQAQITAKAIQDANDAIQANLNNITNSVSNLFGGGL